MKRSLRIYLVLLLGVLLTWLWVRVPSIVDSLHDMDWLGLVGVATLYLCSHISRMLRLALLTLDEREKVFPVVAAHTLTAFPSSFLPFKIGEILRLTAFFHVYALRQKALAVWLAERFGDVLVITAFILGLYLFNVGVPPAVRNVFTMFVVASAIGLLGLFAVAKIFVYLNRHLVLNSHTRRGLALLRLSHALRRLEMEIYKSLEGRLSGFMLLSVLIWTIEVLAMSLFIKHLAIGESDFAALFAGGLLSSLHSGVGGEAFGFYQSLALAVLTMVCLLSVWLAACFKILRA